MSKTDGKFDMNISLWNYLSTKNQWYCNHKIKGNSTYTSHHSMKSDWNYFCPANSTRASVYLEVPINGMFYNFQMMTYPYAKNLHQWWIKTTLKKTYHTTLARRSRNAYDFYYILKILCDFYCYVVNSIFFLARLNLLLTEYLFVPGKKSSSSLAPLASFPGRGWVLWLGPETENILPLKD